jgi:outer membrane biosynthesis protein TonB
MKARLSLYLSAVLMVAMLGAACSKAPNDAQISSQVQERLSADSGLQGKQVGVQSADGVVILTGAVDNDAQREAAERYAKGISGVKRVVNDLQIAPPPVVQAAEPAPPPVEEKPTPIQRKEPAPKPKPEPKKRRVPVKEAEMASAGAGATAAGMEQSQDAQPMPTQQAAPAPAPPPPPQKVTIPAGTTLAIRLVDGLDSETNQSGETFRATLNSPLSVEGEVAIPAGYDVEGHIVEVKSAGKFAGQSVLVLQLDRISAGGKSYAISTDQYKREGSSRGKNTAAKVGAGAAIGAIIGGIAGGGKGAAIGAAAGGGVGGGVQAATKGQQIKLPSETVLNFTLQNPLTVVPTGERHSSGTKMDQPMQ